MSKKELIQLCTSHISASEINDLQDFLKRMKHRNAADVPNALKKFIFTEIIVLLFFSILTGNPSLELFCSLFPFEIMILVFYAIAVIGIISHNAGVTNHISHALAHPECITRSPDTYIFVHEKRERVGNDVTSSTIRSALFQKSPCSAKEHFYVGTRSGGLFFDPLEPRCRYQIYTVDKKIICFVKCKSNSE